MHLGIVLVDDHKLFREGVRALLEKQEGLQVVGEADDGKQAVELVRRLSPQVVIMDVSLPGLSGIEATLKILQEKPGIKVIALSMHAHRHFVQDMLKAGAAGYLLKECAFKELVQAIRQVCEEDRIYLSQEITQQLVEDYLQPQGGKIISDSTLLTPREKEILRLIAAGNTNEKIAQALNMKRRTVEKNRANLMEKLKIDNLAGLVKFAIREGLTEL